MTKLNMALIASDPGQTSRGDEVADDGFIQNFRVVKQVSKVNAIPATEERKGRDERAAHTLVTVGNCEDMVIDGETGFVGMTDVLHYTGLLCTTDHSSLKKAMTAWFKKPSAIAIASILIQRDRGASQFNRKEDDVGEIFAHPIQLLANTEVGVNTRTWLMSVAAFCLSYHQIMKAYEQCPRDFARIDEHIENLQTRVAVMNDESCINRLVDSALTKTKAPYSDFDYRSMALDAITRLSLLARADLEVLKYIQKLGVARSLTETKSKKKGSTSGSETQESPSEVSIEQLRYLKDVAEKNGDLWTPRSSHVYKINDQAGAISVFPSGYLYSIIGGPGVTGTRLMRDRTALSRMESLIPYIPYELSGYSGSLSTPAKLEAEHRGRKSAAKIDHESARAQIAAYASRLAIVIVTDPLLLAFGKRTEPAAPPRKSRAAEPAPEADDEDVETDE